MRRQALAYLVGQSLVRDDAPATADLGVQGHPDGRLRNRICDSHRRIGEMIAEFWGPRNQVGAVSVSVVDAQTAIHMDDFAPQFCQQPRWFFGRDGRYRRHRRGRLTSQQQDAAEQSEERTAAEPPA